MGGAAALNGDVAAAIAQWLPSDDLARFCVASQMVYVATLPVLYRNVYIITSHAWKVHSFASFYATISRRPVLGRFVRSLFISYHGPTSNVLRLLALLPRLQSLHSAHTFRTNANTLPNQRTALASLSSLSCEWTPWLDELMGHMQPMRRLHVDIPHMRRDAPALAGLERLLLASLNTLEELSITDLRVLLMFREHQHLSWPRVRRLEFHVATAFSDVGQLLTSVFPHLRQLHGRGSVDLLSSPAVLPALDYAQIFVSDDTAARMMKPQPSTMRRSIRHLMLEGAGIRESDINANIELALSAVQPEKLQSLAVRVGSDLIPTVCGMLAGCFSLSYLFVCCRPDTVVELSQALTRLRPHTAAQRLRCIGFNISPSPTHYTDPIIVEKLALKIDALKRQFPLLRLVELRTFTRTKLLGAMSIVNIHWRISRETGQTRRVQSDFRVWDVACCEGPEHLDSLQVLH